MFASWIVILVKKLTSVSLSFSVCRSWGMLVLPSGCETEIDCPRILLSAVTETLVIPFLVIVRVSQSLEGPHLGKLDLQPSVSSSLCRQWRGAV